MFFGNNMSKAFFLGLCMHFPRKIFLQKGKIYSSARKNILLSSRLEKESVKKISFKQIVILWYQAENLIKPIPWSSVPLLLDLA